MSLGNEPGTGGVVKPRLPEWLKVRLPGGERYHELKSLMSRLRLNTVCEDAKCPNVGECWGRGVATFMILGDVCTRGCRYCAVAKGKPLTLDPHEPDRVAEAARVMRLRHVVVTSVDRDDLPDGGASIFAATVRRIRAESPGTFVEVLIPDFRGDEAALRTVLEAKPDVLNHNTETVPRLYKRVRVGGRYDWTIELLRRSRAIAPAIATKTGLMLGLGETEDEVLAVLSDLVSVGVAIVTLGQYLRPTPQHLPVERFVTPGEFRALKEKGEALGIPHVESGPLVRSSYAADRQFAAVTTVSDTVVTPRT